MLEGYIQVQKQQYGKCFSYLKKQCYLFLGKRLSYFSSNEQNIFDKTNCNTFKKWNVHFPQGFWLFKDAFK